MKTVSDQQRNPSAQGMTDQRDAAKARLAEVMPDHFRLLNWTVSAIARRRGGAASYEVNQVQLVRPREVVLPRTECEASGSEDIRENERRPQAMYAPLCEGERYPAGPLTEVGPALPCAHPELPTPERLQDGK